WRCRTPHPRRHAAWGLARRDKAATSATELLCRRLGLISLVPAFFELPQLHNSRWEASYNKSNILFRGQKKPPGLRGYEDPGLGIQQRGAGGKSLPSVHLTHG